MKQALITGLSCAILSGIAGAQPQSSHKNIVETAVAAGSFKTLAAALEAADLVDALQGKGPFTVFAPTDDAFAKLPRGTVESLLKRENRARLTSILTYHVVPGNLRAEDVLSSSALTTLNGQRAGIGLGDDGARIDGARIVTTDIACSNGTIHVIDSVILPEEKNLVEVAAAAGNFGTLLKAATEADLADALGLDGPFTVFAPTDAAFAKLPKGTIASLLEPRNRARLAGILKYHVVPGRVFSDQAIAAGRATTLADAPVTIDLSGGRLQVQGANVIANDVQAANGVIHVVDSVLMPPAPPAPKGRLVIGFTWERPGRALADQLGIDRNTSYVVTGVTKGSEAAAGGLRVNDIITEVDHQPVTNGLLDEVKKEKGFGGEIVLDIVRKARAQKLTVRVGIEKH